MGIDDANPRFDDVGPDLLSTFNNLAASYDINGNLASYNNWTYSYDAQNRLKTVKQGATTMAQYWYDGLNRQITRKISGGAPTFNVWDGWNLIEEYASGGTTPQNAYLYGLGGSIIENLTSQYFYYQDGRGNTSHLSDAVGTLLEKYTYSGFGQPSFYNASGGLIGASAYNARHLFQGQLWTQETGLNDHRNRVALPTMGRFLQPDPTGFAGDPSNLYRYCGNNGVNRRDTMGLIDEEGAPKDLIDSTGGQDPDAGISEGEYGILGGRDRDNNVPVYAGGGTIYIDPQGKGYTVDAPVESPPWAEPAYLRIPDRGPSSVPPYYSGDGGGAGSAHNGPKGSGPGSLPSVGGPGMSTPPSSGTIPVSWWPSALTLPYTTPATPEQNHRA
jgi:RHS repeat-associated protein